MCDINPRDHLKIGQVVEVIQLDGTRVKKTVHAWDKKEGWMQEGQDVYMKEDLKATWVNNGIASRSYTTYYYYQYGSKDLILRQAPCYAAQLPDFRLVLK